MALGVLRVVTAKNRNYQWLSVILLSLVITNLGGCDNNTQENDQSTTDVITYQNQDLTATARLKVISESMDADDITEIRELINSGADVNVINRLGGTPLMIASMKGHTEVVKLLLEAGADF